MPKMRPAVIIVLAVLIVALVAFAVEYDGDYGAAWGDAKQQVDKVGHELENWLGKDGH